MSERAEVCCVCGKSLAGQTTIYQIALPAGQGFKSDFCSVKCAEKYIGRPCTFQQVSVRDIANEDKED